jgi:lysophospholipase L1-like esterase
MRTLGKILLILLITGGLYWAIDIAYGYYAGGIQRQAPPNPANVPGLRGLPYASGDFMIEAGQTIDTEAVPGTGILTPKEFHGYYFNIDRKSPTDLLYRRTTNPEPAKSPTVTVLLIGDLTVFGADAPDWLTIASLLSRRLNTDDKSHGYVVLNAGTFGANATMERERLQYELSHGQKPAIVIVMDGGLGSPGRTFAEGRGQVADLFHRYFPHNIYIYWALRPWLSERVARVGLKKPPANIQKPLDVEKLTKDTVAFYLDNEIAMARMAKEAGARFIAVLEPNRYGSSFSHPTDDLEFVDHQTDAHNPGLRAVMPKALGALSAGNASLKGEGLETLDLTTLFKDKTQNLFTDGAGHFNSIGNDMVADRLAAAILSGTAVAQP